MRNVRRVLALTLGNDAVASSRVRISAPLATMRRDGWSAGRVSAASRAWPLFFLAEIIFSRPEVTIVQKVVPPGWFCKVIASLSHRLVFECDDAIQLGYNADPRAAMVIAKRLRILLPLCDCVTVSNEQLGEDFRQLGARAVVVFPGPAPKIHAQFRDGREGILWLGSPSTLANVQSVVYPALELLPTNIELTVVGATEDCDRERIAERIWSIGLQRAALARARVGVAPQAVDEWSNRKAFYKVLEYLASAVVPVVPEHRAVRMLLGDELEIVAVTASDDSGTAWATAIQRAFLVEIDEQWTTARDRIFARWSAERLGRVMLG